MRFAPLTLTFLLLIAGPTWAQAPDSEPALPEITPREIEIRGEYRVVFPSLERPTLQELQPRTRVQALPLDDLPSASPLNFRVDALPPLDLSAPPADRGGSLPVPALLDGMNGFLEGSGGRFTERRVATELQFPVSTNTSLRLHGDYEGMRGDTPFAESDARTAYDSADGGIDLSYRGASWSLTSTVDGAYDEYDLYALQAAASNATESPARRAYALGTEHTLRIHQGLPLAWTVGYRVHDVETDPLPALTQPPATEATTHRFASALDITFPLAVFDFMLEGETEFVGHDGNGAFSGDSRQGTLYGIARLVDRPGLTVEAGAALMSFVTSQQGPGFDGPTTSTYGAPYGFVEWMPAADWRFYAEQRPTLTLHTPIDLLHTNPYLNTEADLGGTVHTLNTTAGTSWSPGPLRVDLYGGVRYSPVRQFFEFGIANATGLYATLYRESTAWEVGLDATLQALSPWFGTVAFTYTEGSLADADGLPFVPRASAEATVGYQFADRRARVQVHLRGQGPRDLDREGMQSAPGFVGMGLSGDVQVTPNIEFTGYVQDIGSNNMTEWPGYPRPVARVGGGVRILW